jgi:hypothetical protein
MGQSSTHTEEDKVQMVDAVFCKERATKVWTVEKLV